MFALCALLFVLHIFVYVAFSILNDPLESLIVGSYPCSGPCAMERPL